MLIILYVLYCQHIPCADPFLGCNVSCCRLFRRRVRCLRSWSYTQWCRWSWWTHLSSKSSAVIVLDGLKPCLSYLISLEIFDVISVWLLLCYKSSICTVRVSITDPGMTLVHSSTGHLRSGRYTTCTYRMDTDGRTHLNSVGWKRFLVGKNLRVGQAILITIRNTNRPGLRMMIVFDII